MYRSGRGAYGLHETLADVTGLLQSDGCIAYESYIKKHDVERVSCLVHIRRRFFAGRSNHWELAELAFKAIQYLYRTEALCRDNSYTSEQRLRVRNWVARPAYDGLLEWVIYQQRNNLSKGNIGTALGYAKTTCRVCAIT